MAFLTISLVLGSNVLADQIVACGEGDRGYCPCGRQRTKHHIYNYLQMRQHFRPVDSSGGISVDTVDTTVNLI